MHGCCCNRERNRVPIPLFVRGMCSPRQNLYSVLTHVLIQVTDGLKQDGRLQLPVPGDLHKCGAKAVLQLTIH